MSNSDPNTPPLSAVQRWMQAVIMHPDGVDAGLESAAAREHLDIGPAEIEQVVSRSQALTSVERLSIYADAYYARLLECLGEEFPVLKQTLGEETFTAFAFDYLQRYPSRSYTLGKLGESFVGYLQETRPTESDDSETAGLSADWPDFLIDLATIEWTFSQVFDGPGNEGEPPLSSDALLAIDPQHWGGARLEMAPCLRLLALRFPVNAYYGAARHGEQPDLPGPALSWLAVTRRDFVVRRHDLTLRQFELLAALAAGDSIGHAIEKAADVPGSDLEAFVAELGNWFREWAAEGFFRHIVLGDVADDK